MFDEKYVVHSAMHKHTISLLFVAILFGCTPPPTAIELGNKYLENPTAYEQLKKMIIEDTRQRHCFNIGTDNIGNYWEHDGKWKHHDDYETYVGLTDVLLTVGLTQNRYKQYLKYFERAGAERVEHCQETVLWGRWIRVLIYRSGLAVSGCTGTLEWFEHDPPLSKGTRGDGYFEVQKLKNGWRSMVDCT